MLPSRAIARFGGLLVRFDSAAATRRLSGMPPRPTATAPLMSTSEPFGSGVQSSRLPQRSHNDEQQQQRENKQQRNHKAASASATIGATAAALLAAAGAVAATASVLAKNRTVVHAAAATTAGAPPPARAEADASEQPKSDRQRHSQSPSPHQDKHAVSQEQHAQQQHHHHHHEAESKASSNSAEHPRHPHAIDLQQQLSGLNTLEQVRANPKFRFLNPFKTVDVSNTLTFEALYGPGKFENVEMYHNPTDLQFVGMFKLGNRICGHPDTIHGGAIGVAFDETLGWLFMLTAGVGYTANLNINYRKPLPALHTIVVKAHVDRVEGRKVFLHATLEDLHGLVYADAAALFVVPRNKQALLDRYGKLESPSYAQVVAKEPPTSFAPTQTPPTV
ncbi:hypothetical protein CAOG_02370 [Capsaspora owczarzaki ATCC 30864]|uniref:Thioesterase domain-containing protein n=1 Tax=Capsaspora owczarzaki (strain ATCC 30864) TaxID=595528 RepID=A0A0D2WL49_CAPO3|nr:hypothetical protein CAOG_02370 [Capsaspora owczarzaki ATCC 30864]KJE91205.1 hypothetical protein CAOG_002370 [Capsaspora owczarzaki ATCC 30864]|eukprot:XP_004349120.1 hypothetical protein CAOG_02370 [Capsaspora owczarzaki ATCC 30864]